MRIGGEQQAGVVVDQVENLDVSPVGQAPVGRVGLPELVRQGRLEADERESRPLVRLRGDQPVAPKDAPYRRRRGNRLEAAAEMVGDRRRPGVVTGLGQLGPQQGCGRRKRRARAA